ncbi:hypothetical protein CHU93_09125 [Sandarakinorhabdus cyanobacteriorum]|uniref:Uncharacterized protein n=1 Tax=Sandarakinorhabdus cyanobacteriorum TaxID=1981098 RepID=A0A255YG86_9SPHN|nr:hypothetical protein [Sandarakinorhabdus cyanobacteriorum]OYQ28267.1 hypothetical protein CHU93_09125 [Sandarakinorhabdus cyanobacteriorum]
MATAAAAVVAKARRDIQHHFFAADAVRPDRAVPFAPAGGIESRQFEAMRARGIILAEGSDRYWLDVVAYDADLQQRYRRVRIILWVAVAAVAIELLVIATR